jgi:protein MAK11
LPIKQESPELVRAFTHAAHKGVVKSLASAGPFVASGGADDLIHLYDLKSDKDLGFLMNPGEGAVSSLVFFTPKEGYSPTHLLAGCSDGTISVWRAGGGWECMRTLRGHRGEVSSIAVHPSGCLALTTARDGTLKLWDLVKGRVTFSTKVENDADGVIFAPSGVRYALHAGNIAVVRLVTNPGGGSASTSTEGSEVGTVQLQHTRRVQSILFGQGGDGIIITGAEDGALRVWDAVDGRELLHIPRAHSSRVKKMSIPYCSEETSGASGATGKKKGGVKDAKTAALLDQVPQLLATASSDGAIKIWKLRSAVAAAIQRGTPEPEDGGESVCLCQTNTKARITTLCCVDPIAVMEKKMEEQKTMKQINQKKKKKEHKKSSEAPKNESGKKPSKDAPKKTPVGVKNAPAMKKKGQAPTKKPVGEKKKEPVPKVIGSVQKDGTVSFMGVDDRMKQNKKERKVRLGAKRAAEQRAGQRRRENVPGTRGPKDA